MIYAGLTFTIGDSFLFEVEELAKRFESYREMTDAIDKAAKAKAATERERLDFEVIDGDGVTRKLTGVNARNGDLLLTPTIGDINFFSRNTISGMFPKVGWIPDVVARRIALRAELEKIDVILTRLEVKSHDGFSWNKTTHKEAITRVKRAFDSATAFVKKNSIDKAMEIAATTIKHIEA